MAKTVYRETTAKQTLNRVKEPRMPFDWSINPYRGCAHGCSFCYARATHTFLGMNADDSFQHHILLKANAAEALKAQLARIAKSCDGDLREAARQVGLVAIGTATDPYQPVEAKAELTRACLKVLAAYRIPVTITTRSPLILRDLDVLKEMRVASINISVNTLDAGLCRRLEPATPHPLKRLETVQRLVEHGLPAGVFIAPILPYLTDSAEALEEVVSAAKRHGARYASPSVLRLAPEVRAWYLKTLREQFPSLAAAYESLYRTAYPARSYTEAVMARVHRILERYGLSTQIPDSPEWPEPVPTEAASGEERECGEQLRWEQLSFF